MKTQQLITGGAIIISALILLILTIMETLITLFYVIPLIIIGIAILLNKKEDVVERIKKIK
jgi:antibiotic biosynthesis monooxygenase (ABM) superfamily enzyme